MKWQSHYKAFRSLNDEEVEQFNEHGRDAEITNEMTIGDLRFWHPMSRIPLLQRLINEALAQGRRVE